MELTLLSIFLLLWPISYIYELFRGIKFDSKEEFLLLNSGFYKDDQIAFTTIRLLKYSLISILATLPLYGVYEFEISFAATIFIISIYYFGLYFRLYKDFGLKNVIINFILSTIGIVAIIIGLIMAIVFIDNQKNNKQAFDIKKTFNIGSSKLDVPKNLNKDLDLSILKSSTNNFFCLRENNIKKHKTKSECWDGQLISQIELEYISSMSNDLKNINEIFYYCKDNGFKLSDKTLNACGIFLEKEISEIDTSNNQKLSKQIDEIKNSVKNIDKRQRWEKFLKLLKEYN